MGTLYINKYREVRGLGCWLDSNVPLENTYDVVFPWLNPSIDNIYIPLIGHLHCNRTPKAATPLQTRFNFTFYEIFGPTNRSDVTTKIWKAGPLHSDGQQYWALDDYRKFAEYDEREVR